MIGVPGVQVVECVDVRAIHAWLVEHTPEMVDDLVVLANLETPSDDLELLQQGLAHVEHWVTERLGRPDARSLFTSDQYGAVLVLDYEGQGEKRIICLGHYDTVYDAGTLTSWPVEVHGDKISGPGVFDMKGGLVQAVWALRALSNRGIARPSVRLVLNGDEEIGSPFSRPLLEEASAGAAAVLVFEASADGALKTARKGVGLFELTATGIEAHSGLNPELGASAIHELARAITILHEGADLSRGTSINAGVVSGGTRANVTAGFARAKLDIRVSNPQEQERVDGLLASLTPTDDRVNLDVLGEWNRPIMMRTDAIERMYVLARAVGHEIGLDIAEVAVGGASDGNFLAALGIPVLDGIGAVGSGAHARHENVRVAGMVERAALAAGILAAFSVGADKLPMCER